VSNGSGSFRWRRRPRGPARPCVRPVAIAVAVRVRQV